MREREIGNGRVVAGWLDLYRTFFVHWRGVVTEEDGMLKEGHVRERIEQMLQCGFTREERREGEKTPELCGCRLAVRNSSDRREMVYPS